MTLHSHQLEINEYLHQVIKAYYVLDYFGWGKPNNPDFINDLKNDFGEKSDYVLDNACKKLRANSYESINEIIKKEKLDTICIVPRAKREAYYKPNQLLFSATMRRIALDIGVDIKHILRIENTKTTHFHHKPEYGGDGDSPYPSITKKTCLISFGIKGKNILLIDDIYTKTINIDEDCIQALLDEGANKVVLFTVAKTAHHSDSKQGVQYDFDAFGNPINSYTTTRYDSNSLGVQYDAFGNPINNSKTIRYNNRSGRLQFDAFGNPINSSKTARYNDRSRSSRLDAFGNPVNTSDDDIPF